jgi:hypothetical protein
MTITFVPDDPPAAPLIEHDDNVVEINRAKEHVPDRERVEKPLPPGWRRPKHGRGALRNFQPGNAGRPPNVSTRFSETLEIARRASPEAMRTLIQRMSDPDGRIAVMSASLVLERAWGKPREQRPEEHEEKARIDLSQLKAEELALLVRLVESGRLQSVSEQPTSEPLVIEGKTSDD